MAASSQQTVKTVIPGDKLQVSGLLVKTVKTVFTRPGKAKLS